MHSAKGVPASQGNLHLAVDEMCSRVLKQNSGDAELASLLPELQLHLVHLIDCGRLNAEFVADLMSKYAC